METDSFNETFYTAESQCSEPSDLNLLDQLKRTNSLGRLSQRDSMGFLNRTESVGYLNYAKLIQMQINRTSTPARTAALLKHRLSNIDLKDIDRLSIDDTPVLQIDRNGIKGKCLEERIQAFLDAINKSEDGIVSEVSNTERKRKMAECDEETNQKYEELMNLFQQPKQKRPKKSLRLRV